MSYPSNTREYVQRFMASLLCCEAIPSEDRAKVLSKPVHGQNDWLIARGTYRNSLLAEEDPVVAEPFELINGGRLALKVRLREIGQGRSQRVDVVAYEFSILGLPQNPNGLQCLRYDKPEGQPRGDGWDDDLGDNPHHPWAHLHINFAPEPADLKANELRLPTGSVCPALLLRAFDYWYCTTIKSNT